MSTVDSFDKGRRINGLVAGVRVAQGLGGAGGAGYVGSQSAPILSPSGA